jgi:DNA mismatch endonuclease (patch repair protein)
MRNVKLKDGPLEAAVHAALRAQGIKFRRHDRSLPGSPDVVLPRQRVVVFVDGDFWHGWRLPTWEAKLTRFWRQKLRANRKRDRRNIRLLRSRGWRVVRLWQHQIERDMGSCIHRIILALETNRP